MSEVGKQNSDDPRYEIKETISSGGFGTILKAWDNHLHRFVALKRLDQSNVDQVTKVDDMWWEAISLASMQHPNILSIYDFNVDDDGPYIITEFIDGMNLAQFVKAHRYSRTMFQDAVQQTLRGLIAAHEKDLVHRDIKPKNIMVMRLPGHYLLYKILDFGMVDILDIELDDPFAKPDYIYGSLYFIAPEQLKRQPPDFKTDLYSMGCVYYYMLTGRNPFTGKTSEDVIMSHLRHRVMPLHKIRPDIPDAVNDWVMNLISLEPQHRPETAKKALDLFQHLTCGGNRQGTTTQLVVIDDDHNNSDPIV